MANHINGPTDAGNDLEFIRQRLLEDAQTIELPDRLRAENLLPLLERLPETEADTEAEAEAPTLRLVKRRWLQLAAYAACGVLVFTGLYHVARQTAGGLSTVPVSPSSSAANPVAPVAPESGNGASPMLMSAPDEEPVAAPEPNAAPETTQQAPALAGRAARSVPVVDTAAEPLAPAQSYDDVAQRINDLAARRQAEQEAYRTQYESYKNATSDMRSASSAAPAPAAPMADESVRVNPGTAGPGTGGGGDESGVFETNAQVAGVDEADIVKTDGTYIYQYRRDRNTGASQIAIVGATNLKLLSTIELDSEQQIDFSSVEMYLKNNHIVVIRQFDEGRASELWEFTGGVVEEKTASSQAGNGTATAPDGTEVIVPDYVEPDQSVSYRTGPMTETLVFNVSNRSDPKQVGSYGQDGYYVTSRVKDGTLYLITNKDTGYSMLQRAASEPDMIPLLSSGNTLEPMAATDILLPKRIEDTRYAVVTALDFAGGTRSSKAVLGVAEQVMMSTESLFLTSSIWKDNSYRTGLVRFAVDGTDIQYVSSGSVPGNIDNQFSLDEYNGNLRIATTVRDAQWNSSNSLYVLDSAMKLVGSVEGLAPDERIYSVRFMGDMAYVVTFRETDPLFVIDLSNPAKPVVKGELKIPGFSEYLHPVDENTLVGLGRNTVTNSYGGVMNDGLKLSLFDVSDPSNPIEKASYLMGNGDSSTPALDDHRAVMYYPQKKLIGFPATITTAVGGSAEDVWRYADNVVFAGYLMLQIEDDGFTLAAKLENAPVKEGFEHYDFNNAIERGVYIGKTLYTCSPGRLTAYSMDTYQPIGELVYEN